MTVRTARRVAVPVAVVVAVALALGAVVFTSLQVGRSAWVVPSAYSVSADGRTLTLHVWGGADTVLARADVIESRWGLPARKWLRVFRQV